MPAGIAVFFCLAEILCRLFNLTNVLDADFKFFIRNVDNDLRAPYNQEDALLMWRMKPNYKEGFIQTNTMGLRDTDYALRKPPAAFRILCLGDSSTFGMNRLLSETYHAILEKRLNQDDAATPHRFEVINGGVTGYTSLQCLLFYEHIGARYAPDLVVCYVGVNDAKQAFHLSDKDILQTNMPVAVRVFTNRVLLKSSFYRVLRKLLLRATRRNIGGNGHKVPRVSREDFRANIVELQAACRKRGAALVLIRPPVHFRERRVRNEEQAEFVARYESYEDVLVETAAAHAIPLLAIPEMAREHEATNESLFDDSTHPSTTGHQLIAKRLRRFLTEKSLLPQRSKPQLPGKPFPTDR